MFGRYPGHQITPLKTPGLANACRKGLEINGDETTGWSKGWKQGLKLYRELLNYVAPDDVKTDYQQGGGTYPNLLYAHPSFKVDGNFGGAAAVIEMLMQSSESEIRLLPALPNNWESGSIKGIRACDGYEIAMAWKNKKFINVSIQSNEGWEVSII